MLTVITGGSGSGKSEMAEEAAIKSGRRRIYIATMQPFGEEAQKRIARHRKMRQEKAFETMEIPVGLSRVQVPPGSSVLLECLSNLCANEMFSKEGAGDKTEEAVMEGIAHLINQAGHLIVVTNEIFSDGLCYDAMTTAYIETLGRLNQKLFSQADRVIESVYGLPYILKGEKT